MDDVLPTYHEATARADWLALAGPYVQFADYRALCLVSRRFWRVFAPRLWGDILDSAARLGLDPAEEFEWWMNLVYKRLTIARPTTLQLVHTLDFRRYSHLSSYQSSDGTAQESFRQAICLSTNVEAILIDGHKDLRPYILSSLETPPTRLRPRLLSLAGCPTHLPNSLFLSASLQELTYLDLSGIQGSVQSSLYRQLPCLEILKLRWREMDNRTALELFRLRPYRLWSMDLSHNKLTDQLLSGHSVRPEDVLASTSTESFDVEGRVRDGPLQSTTSSVQESQWSEHFNHPHRFFVDPPKYEGHPDHLSRSPVRADGSRAPIDDSIQYCARHHPPVPDRGRLDLTHLHLSGNLLSQNTIEHMIQLTKGRLESLSCDSTSIWPSKLPLAFTLPWPKWMRLQGFLGLAHLFRPLLSSNLRTLRIHHSLVTRIPTLDTNQLSSLARAYLSETVVLPRVRLAYGQAFVPDMNPRLSSLTLTGIPRQSTGPLIKELISFLRLLSLQEEAIQKIQNGAGSVRHAPPLLKGLRHLALIFEPFDSLEGVSSYAREEDFFANEDLDVDELLYNDEEEIFSFFKDEWPKVTKTQSTANHQPKSESGNASDEDRDVESDLGNKDYMEYHDAVSDPDRRALRSVWIGSPVKTDNPVIREYRRLALHGVRYNVGLCTPAQKLAGAPEGCHIFQTAWAMAIIPSDERQLQRPSMAQLAGMRGVLAELKKYRQEGRLAFEELKVRSGGQPVPLGDPHYFWTGKLEVSHASLVDFR